MTAILESRESTSLWARFCEGVTRTDNRLSVLVTHSQKRAQRLVLSRLSKIAVIKIQILFFLFL
jgi:hypothetical protein